MKESHNPIIVALDVSSTQEALTLVELLADSVGLFKIGLQLYTAEGPSIVRKVREKGGRVFLDLKLHDIPNTVGSAAVEAGRLGAEMLTLHTLGGAKMLRHTRDTVDHYSQEEGWLAPKLLGVTVLTSMDQNELASIGVKTLVRDQVAHLCRLASEVRLDGVVASPQELPILRTAGLSHLLCVTPGIRPIQASKDDQARAATPYDACLAGADYLVIGRPITWAPAPATAAGAILAEVRRAIEGRESRPETTTERIKRQ
jgi:orotidine-5'-phosphate decarboxylase